MILEACLSCANGGMAPPSSQAIGWRRRGEGGINCGGEQPMLRLQQLLLPAGLHAGEEKLLLVLDVLPFLPSACTTTSPLEMEL